MNENDYLDYCAGIQNAQSNKLTTENPFLTIFTARKLNGKLTRPNLMFSLYFLKKI